MKALFNADSPLMRFLSRVADIMLLNALWLLCCVPIVTAGAATTAMYHVTLKLAAGADLRANTTAAQTIPGLQWQQ